MAGKFKVGDIVVCVDLGGNSLIQVGDKYTICSVGSSGKIRISPSNSHYYNICLFELYKPKPKPKATNIFGDEIRRLYGEEGNKKGVSPGVGIAQKG